MDEELSNAPQRATRFRLAIVGFVLFLIFVVGLFWLATTPEQTVGLTLSFVAGLSMIFLPCTLPLAFVIVPMTLGKDPKKGFLMAVSFGLGLTITLSFYGVFIAALGKTFGLKSDAEVYAVLLGGIAAFLFGLSEIGLLNFKLPSYSGKFPDFIQRQKDYVKTFLLGLLLGNAGVGCPNPAFYVLLGYIATTADLFNGWILGFVHGLGRAVPLIFLAILGTLGINTLSGVARHKETVERAMGWMLVFIGAYLLTFGIFGHDWFIASGIHGSWERFVSGVGGEQFGEVILKHEHKLIDVPNFIRYGNIFFLTLLLLTMLTAFVRKRPSRRTIQWVSLFYVVVALTIGYSTGWTFKIGTNIHIQFSGATAEPHAMGDAHGVLYHEEADVQEGLVVNLNATPVPIVAGTSTRLDFFVNQKPGNIPVTDLEIEHEKLMHVIGVRSDMNEFFHIHPQFVPQAHHIFSIPYVFVKPGVYKLWSEIKRDGVRHAFGHPEVMVRGEGEKFNKRVGFGRNVIIGNYQVALRLGESVPAGREVDLLFDVHTLDSFEIELEDYLAAEMHLAVIKDDWKQFIHTHPAGETDHHGMSPLVREVLANGGGHDTSEAGHGVNFHVTFPEPGLYKVFAQFRPQGIGLPRDEAFTAAFWIQVEKQAVSQSAQWWVLLILSLIFMALLGVGVYKYLQIKR